MLSQLQPLIELVETAPTVPEVAAKAPPGVGEKATPILEAIKWGSVMLVFALLLGTGAVVVGGNNGFGGGVSSKMKQHIGGAIGGLVIVASAAQLVNWIA